MVIRKQYTKEFKLDAISLVLEQGHTTTEVSRSLGLVLDMIIGLPAFRRANTAVNPLCPERTNIVVHNDIYSYTRNPMYLGFALMLLGFCVYLGNPLSLIAIIAFIAYITRYQIIPEERVLTENLINHT